MGVTQQDSHTTRESHNKTVTQQDSHITRVTHYESHTIGETKREKINESLSSRATDSIYR